AGAKNFIVKPFKPDAVISTLDRLVEKEDMVGA
ncbi:MAG: DNA-binding NtrC family response regulator, partial [Myxococcota bacterium]